jgi:L-methionine (R)-S-oxide reductase
MPCDASQVLLALTQRAAETADPDSLGQALVEAIRQNMPKANWVGIYWLQGEELVLGPYVGAPTEHTRIPVGRGVCGTAMAERRDQIVADVREVENYLACSATTRSEMVVLIHCMGKVIGQVDMDSDEVGAFGAVEHCIVRAIADAFSGILSLTASGRFMRTSDPQAPKIS